MRLGHVHLKVSDLTRAEEFYQNLLGARPTEKIHGSFSFLTMGEAHHEIALQALGPSAKTPTPNTIGLYHSAFEVSSANELLEAVIKLEKMQFEYTLIDHGISWALYTSDPDGNGVEIYLDRRKADGGTELWRGHSYSLVKSDLMRASIKKE